MEWPTLPPEARITRITFAPTCLNGSIEQDLWSITVEDRGPGWAVLVRGIAAVDKDGHVEYEPLPSSRSKTYLRRFRHSLPDALALAERMLPTITVNGMTAEQAATQTPRP